MSDLINQHLDIWTSAIASKATARRGTSTPSPKGEGRGEGNPTNTRNAKVTAYGIKKLRELILELAVRGKLVPQDANDEPASVLLKKVCMKKGEAKKEKSLPDIDEGEMPFQLPAQWEWVRFGHIAQHNSGKTLDRGRNTGKLRDYITTSNLYWGRFNLNNIRQMPMADDELEKCTAKKGDLLICEGGEAGRAAVWNYDYDVCFQNHVHRARFYGDIDPYFAYRFFEKLNATGEIDQHRKGVGISNMSSKALALIVMPIPPLAEQHRIVAKVDELMALCDQLEQQQTDNIAAHQTLVQTLLDTLTQAADAAEFEQAWNRIADHFDTLFTTESSIDQLKQTLLQLAVMGKLVPQDPNDEPAGRLLLRINNELCSMENIKELPKLKRDSSTVDPKGFQFNVPNSWIWCELQDISLFSNGKAHEQFVTEEPNYILINSRFVSNGGEVYKYVTKRLSPLLEGDIAIVMSDVPDGRALVRCFVVDNSDRYTLNQRIGGIRTATIMSVQYLALVLDRNPYYLQYDDGKKQTNLKKIQILSCPIPLSPLNEQHRIIAKVDELMGLCDALKVRIAAAQTTQLLLADAIVEQAVV